LRNRAKCSSYCGRVRPWRAGVHCTAGGRACVNDGNQAFVGWLATYAEQKKAAPAQIALAWLGSRGSCRFRGRRSVIDSRRTSERPEFKLSAGDLQKIDRTASQIEVHGARYPEHLQKLVGQ